MVKKILFTFLLSVFFILSCTITAAADSFDISEHDFSLSKTAYTYTGDVHSPKVISEDLVEGKDYYVKNSSRAGVGTATVKVIGIGDYYGEKKLNFTIRPRGTSIMSLTKGNYGFTAKWKKKSGATGYQIRYSKNSSMKKYYVRTIKSNKTVKKTVSNLSGFTVYYVQVRTYKVVSGKKYYSSWSTKKSIGTKAGKAGYSIVKKDHSGYSSDTYVNCYYKYPVLKGNTSVIKKINSSIRKGYQNFLDSGEIDDLYYYADLDANLSGEYFDQVDCKITYNKNHIICVKYETYWFAGGVVNRNVYGRTYSLKTGKRLYLDDVCKGSSTTIKNNIASKMKKKTNELWDTAISDMKKKKLHNIQFYIKPENKAVICFSPYEVGYGGYSRTFIIKSRYK